MNKTLFFVGLAAVAYAAFRALQKEEPSRRLMGGPDKNVIETEILSAQMRQGFNGEKELYKEIKNRYNSKESATVAPSIGNIKTIP